MVIFLLGTVGAGVVVIVDPIRQRIGGNAGLLGIELPVNEKVVDGLAETFVRGVVDGDAGTFVVDDDIEAAVLADLLLQDQIAAPCVRMQAYC